MAIKLYIHGLWTQPTRCVAMCRADDYPDNRTYFVITASSCV